eukprot:c12472_g1_i1 orf=2-250(-)
MFILVENLQKNVIYLQNPSFLPERNHAIMMSSQNALWHWNSPKGEQSHMRKHYVCPKCVVNMSTPPTCRPVGRRRRNVYYRSK